MMVEDGRPVFISTLDLDPLAVRPVLGDSPAAPHRTRAVELMKLFPEHGWKLRLGTAARLSASFPYFSPAATLPTIPPRRLVDAGYLDNYGMGPALGWVERHALETDTLPNAARRVIVLELRPYGTWRESPVTDEEWRATGGRVPQFVGPLQGLTTPPEGGEVARKAAMVTRNNDQLGLLQQALDDPEFLTNVVLKGDLRASLNWTLPRAEVDEIHQVVAETFGTGPVRDQARRDNNHRELQALLKEFAP
jgi:hypothetical protein